MKPNATVMRIRIKNTDKMLLLKRHPKCRVKGWCLPGGRIDEGETIEECVIREVKEETGLSISDPVFVGNYDTIVSGSEGVVAVFDVVVDNEEKVTLSEEHEYYGWFDMTFINQLDIDEQLAGKTMNAINLK